MHDLGDFAMGFLRVYLTGVFAMVLFTLVNTSLVRDQGKAPCENNLPRTEKCVQIWLPEKSIKEGSK